MVTDTMANCLCGEHHPLLCRYCGGGLHPGLGRDGDWIGGLSWCLNEGCPSVGDCPQCGHPKIWHRLRAGFLGFAGCRWMPPASHAPDA